MLASPAMRAGFPLTNLTQLQRLPFTPPLQARAANEGMVFIAPYDDPYVVAGQVRQSEFFAKQPVNAPRCLAFLPSFRACRLSGCCRSSGRCLCCPMPSAFCEGSVRASNAQGTIGNEILRETDMDKLDAIFVAVGEL